MADLAAPPTRIEVGDGRRIAVDHVGDHAGRPVLFLHGSPSCRLARPPLDEEVGRAGVRLLAIDRPGLGQSDPDPTTTAHSFAGDVAHVLNALEVDHCSVVAWSAGAIWALALADHPSTRQRVDHLTIATGLVPAEAFDDRELRSATSESRGGLLDTAAELGAAETAELAAPMMVPYPCSEADAREHLAAVRSGAESAELASVPGGTEQAAGALVETVRQGVDGLVRELTVQLSPLGVDLHSITTPVRLVYGDADEVCPPAFGTWFADRLPNSRLEVLEGASHGLPYTHWLNLLTA